MDLINSFILPLRAAMALDMEIRLQSSPSRKKPPQNTQLVYSIALIEIQTIWYTNTIYFYHIR